MVDDGGRGFYIEAYKESDPTVRGSYNTWRASGKNWRFHHWILTGDAYIDDYREFSATSLLWSPDERVDLGYDALDRLASAAPKAGAQGYSAGYAYSAIGNLTGSNEGGASRTYAYTTTHAHAVGSLSNGYVYRYDADGNMTQRCLGAYVYNLTYDVEGRLVTVTQGATTTVFNYDGDGSRVQGSVAGITFTAVGGYYERTGATTIRKYYTFNGRVVAMRQNGTLSWLLTDQLGSTSMAVSLTGTVQSQQRYWPWGTARNASGTLPTDYRYTWQQEVSVIGLYDYDARWYDPDLKRFVQADAVVPEPGNPQCLNRYSYVLSNPQTHADPTGHAHEQSAGFSPWKWDPDWVERYKAAYGGSEPTQQEWRDYVFSLTHSGSRPGSAWSEGDWQVYSEVQAIVGGDLLAQLGETGGLGTALYTEAGGFLLGAQRAGIEPGPGGTAIAVSEGMPFGAVWPGVPAWTAGNLIIMRTSERENPENKRVLLAHEYVHVLQYRAEGARFGVEYAREGLYDWENNRYEKQALQVESLYKEHRWLPPLWSFPWAGGHYHWTTAR